MTTISGNTSSAQTATNVFTPVPAATAASTDASPSSPAAVAPLPNSSTVVTLSSAALQSHVETLTGVQVKTETMVEGNEEDFFAYATGSCNPLGTMNRA